MKLTVLADNNTYIDMYYLGEPSLSFYIEDEEDRILFDTGYSDVFMKNAKKMKIDLSEVNKVVISHGHNDHNGGLKHFLKKYDDFDLISHPSSFEYKEDENGLYIGSPLDIDEIREGCQAKLSRKAKKISKHLIYLGEIEVSQAFEPRYPIGKRIRYKKKEDDHLLDDSAIVYKGEQGLFIITGCSHSGICNIIEYAKKVCGDDRVYGVIGGFHLFDVDERLKKTIDYFEKNHIEKLYPCHCVSLNAKIEMGKKLKINEVGVGLRLEII